MKEHTQDVIICIALMVIIFALAIFVLMSAISGSCDSTTLLLIFILTFALSSSCGYR